jgi:hypothetical protein
MMTARESVDQSFQIIEAHISIIWRNGDVSCFVQVDQSFCDRECEITELLNFWISGLLLQFVLNFVHVLEEVGVKREIDVQLY